MTTLGRLLAFILAVVLPTVAVLAFDRDGPLSRTLVIVTLALGAMLGLGVAWLSRRRFVHAPLQRLVACANAVREGRYPLRGALAAGVGEFAPLARAFDDMAGQLASREAALRESEQRFRRLSDASFEGIVIHDGERIVETNDTLARLFGYEPGDGIGEPLVDFIAPEAREQVTANVRAGLETPYETIGLRKDGTTFPIETRARQIEYKGRMLRVGVVRDLTDRKKALAAVRESEMRFRQFADNLRDVLWIYNVADNRFEYVSPAYERIFERKAARLLEDVSDWHDSVHPEDREVAKSIMARAITDGEITVAYRVVATDGTIRWLLDHGFAIRDERRRVVRVGGIAEDITERKRDDERLRLLAAEVDHRAKNVLALVQIILRQTRAASVEDFSRIAQGRVAALARAHTLLSESRWQGADLGRLIEEELAPYRRGDGRVSLHGPAVELPPHAAQSFAMALHELTTNAARHGALSESRGSLSVEWMRRDGRLVLRWIETGGPPVQPAAQHGLGMHVIERSIGEQLEGEVRLDWRPDGLVCELIVATDQLES